MPAARASAAVLAVMGKLSVAAGVFASTLLAWAWAEPAIVNRTPLPGGGATRGDCAIWFVGSSTVNKWRDMDRDMAPWATYNRGVDGALLDQLSQRLAHDAAAPAPTAIVVYSGENDIAAGASATTAASGVEHMVTALHARMPATHLFVVATKPSPGRWSFRAEQQRFDRVMRDWPGATFIDVANTLLVAGRPGPFYQPDGIHLSRPGYVRWSGRVRAAVERALPRATVARCTTRSAARR